MSSQQTTAKKGWGYWDVTSYPYGGCFRRLTEDTPVTVIEPMTGKLAGESRVRFADGRVGILTNRALESCEVAR